ncbi:DNA-directed RNA polymerase subunit beta' [Mycoplasmopsis californica]|uniref:DNA-directed RNA polymerase subunit beta' n=1 Tax=Mycoplasmopsis equigenitalium TaxID=114883 RepID=A0ABY5J1X2_9BACT|nr:DNA-directed RNA polymerase subunit beta' [Mycoplasmopsis equigenitalium]UUD36768.1 DNA-directed RNA polymerase subunit beta' [Mycoplasmopsis equigenitalium]VEU69934.1 DNA-directed RNA polymerase subunit beta' [Mycoplasmopsis californica]
MKKIWRKYGLLDESEIKRISLSLATESDVKEWSHGEVTKPETINYKSFKPEKNGLFDELIFGPTTDYKCAICSKKYKQSNENMFCTATTICQSEKPEILPKISRRSRMGHIALHVPVVHFWFFKIDHSSIFKLLGLTIEGSKTPVTKAAIENIIYYKSHIVLESGGLKNLPKNTIIEINDAAVIYKNALLELRERFEENSEEYEDITTQLEELVNIADSKIGHDYGIDFYELNDTIEMYSDAKIGTGSKAIEYLLENVDLEKERDLVKAKINDINKKINDDNKENKTRVQERDRLYKRLFIINSFINSGQKPTSMLIYNLPVIPADLRPLVQLDGGRHSTSDINELYRRIIIRNNRLKKWNELDSPKLIVQNELRMIQEAVDAVIDNSRKTPNPVMSKDNRPLKSISDALAGKKGRFRQNLLGKRVDYSGRSVIVVGPNLKMHQCGIPREMAAKLFEPWIIRELIEKEVAGSIKSARRLIENLNPVIWPHVEKVITNKLVLLNRAPTLHRLSIQAFEPVLIRGKAIKLHPLVTPAFNADFDGDQMAVHVPVSEIAMREARELMLASKNILGPKDGEPIINPSQDMLLGIYYLTQERKGAKGEGRYFLSHDDMLRAYEFKKVELHARVALPISEVKPKNAIFAKKEGGYVVSSVGKFIFNKLFPDNFDFIFDNSIETLNNNKEVFERHYVPYGTNIAEFIANLPEDNPLSKKDVARVIRAVFDSYDVVITKEDIANVISKISLEDYFEKEKAEDYYANLIDFRGNKLDKRHVDVLKTFTYNAFKRLDDRKKHQKAAQVLYVDDYVEILEDVWFKYTNIIATVLDGIKEYGFKYSTKSGTTISISDIITLPSKQEHIQDGERYINELQEAYKEGLCTDDERYKLTIDKWARVKDAIQKDLNEVTKEHPDNPLFIMMRSGARGNISNFVQLAGMRGLMANNAKTLKADAQNERVVRSTVEVPVKSSFLDGLSAYEFYSSTHGARKGLTDTALNTSRSGYLTRRLVDVAQSIVVREEDCGSDFGFTIKDIVDTKTNSIIVPFKERIEGRFTNKPVFDKKGNLIVGANEFITPELATIIDKKVDARQIEIRSILSCHTPNGVCKKCYGKDLATNKIVSIGEAVGIIAAQSIGEPGTQLTMRTFHTGGVAGVEDITGGFGRLIELIDAYEKPWGRPAEIAKYHGRVVAIEEIASGKNKSSESLIIIIYNINGEEVEEKIHFRTNRILRVQVGDNLVPGQKIIEGPIELKHLLDITDPRTVQNYLLKEIQRLYRMQGISISDKYIEIIIRQMLSKIQIQEAGDSKFFVGNFVDLHEYQLEAGKLLAEGKKPPYGVCVIKGAKQTPLLSNSFLAAASYQETAKILVNAAISNQVDNLEGLKENIILGHKIPAGTNSNFEPKSKYDIKDPREYFPDKFNPVIPTSKEQRDEIFEEISKVIEEQGATVNAVDDDSDVDFFNE